MLGGVYTANVLQNAGRPFLVLLTQYSSGWQFLLTNFCYKWYMWNV